MLRTTGATLGRPQVAIHRKFAMPHFLLLAYYRPILIYLLAYFILTVLVANCFSEPQKLSFVPLLLEFVKFVG